jgi:hypothetical protein
VGPANSDSVEPNRTEVLLQWNDFLAIAIKRGHVSPANRFCIGAKPKLIDTFQGLRTQLPEKSGAAVVCASAVAARPVVIVIRS